MNDLRRSRFCHSLKLNDQHNRLMNEFFKEYFAKQETLSLQCIDMLGFYQVLKSETEALNPQSILKQVQYHLFRLTNPVNNPLDYGEKLNVLNLSKILNNIRLIDWKIEQLLGLLQLVTRLKKNDLSTTLSPSLFTDIIQLLQRRLG